MSEQISELMDGELAESAAARQLAQLRQSAELKQAWEAYHLIGDALRGDIFPSYRARCAERLAAEPTVLAPQPAPQAASRPTAASLFRYALSAAAAAGGVALVVWTASPGLNPGSPAIEAAATPLQAESAPVMARKKDVENYLFAHQASSTLQPGIQLVTQEVEEPAR